MKGSGIGAAMAVAALLAAAPAVAQDSRPLDWRLKDANANAALAVAFTAPVDGAQSVTLLLVLARDETVTGRSDLFRAMEMVFEVECGAGRWRMTGGVYRRADTSVAALADGTEWAPLDRSAAAQAMVADVCTGGHSEAVGLAGADAVAAQRWLDGRIVR